MASLRVAALKRALKALAKCLLGDYAIYRVGRVRPARTLLVPSGLSLRVLERQDLEAAPDQELRDSAWYLGSEAKAFGCYEGDHLIALACCWWGDRYRRRSSWPIGASAAKLVHVVTVPAARGRGLAPLLILHAEEAMRREGRTPLYARIWHNNTPSLRAFKHAGWEPMGTLIELNPLRLGHPWRFRLPAF